ncbi:MAG: hypothetical protein WCG85_10025 [Polyangia bacterium]
MKLWPIFLAFVLTANLLVAGPVRAASGTTPTLAPASVPAPSIQPAVDDDGPPRLSLPTDSDRAVWKKPGFRFGLGLLYANLVGINGPPSGKFIGPTIRVGIRLDERWSLMGSLQYLFASGKGGMGGLRYAGTIEPTWHATEHLSLAVGIGFGGLVETGSNPPSTLDASYTYPDARTPLAACNGVGVTGLLRAEWLFVLGPRSSTGVALEGDGQWTGCVDDTGNVDLDTATPIVRRQWWPHYGGSLAWVILWR